MQARLQRSIGRLTRALHLVALLLGLCLAELGHPAVAAPPRDAIQHALQQSADAWSRGNLDGFMSVYLDAPSTTYLKGDSLLHGYAAIRAMYGARFARPGARHSMGKLSLNLLEVRTLGPDIALCTGRFALALGDRPSAHGVFTLVFRHTPAGWKIISDHTSSS